MPNDPIKALVATVSRRICDVTGKSFEDFPAEAKENDYVLSKCPNCGDDTWLGVRTAQIIADGNAEQLCMWCIRDIVPVNEQKVVPLDHVEKITCPNCGRTSFNPNDVRKKYCGACHQYHE
jgi:ribosomal protein S27AE